MKTAAITNLYFRPFIPTIPAQLPSSHCKHRLLLSPYPFHHSRRSHQVNPEDDNTVPIPYARTVHPISAVLINKPKNQLESLHPIQPALKPDDPLVAADVDELTAMFESSLTPEEIAFALAQKAANAPPKPPRLHYAPKNFLQAHMIIIDALLMDPAITTTKLSDDTGYSRSWLHKLMSSDAFAAKLAERQKSIIDPIIANTIKDRIQGLASRSLEIIEERMESDEVSLDKAMEVFSMTSKAMGLGVQKAPPPQINQFIVRMPVQQPSATAWAEQHSGRPAETLSEPIDVPFYQPTSGDSNDQAE